MDPTIVETPFGMVKGLKTGDAIAFRRVRYAPAPTGAARFALPGQPVSWTGVLDCTAPGPIPPQSPSRLAKVMGDYPAAQDEDCLHLDIWVPAVRPQKAAVLVFIHGGAFMTGGGSVSCYDGAALAARTGVVVVNITYRLGALGFLPMVEGAPTNLGLRDQIAALRWIQQAIGAFGGDPECVTLAGQSAGAYSIAILMAAGAKLFKRGIVMSGPLGLAAPDGEKVAGLRHAFLQALGLGANDGVKLLDVPIDQILQAQIALLRRPASAAGDVSPPFVPILDDDLIPRDPLPALLDGAGKWCETMIGWTREEMAAFYVDDERPRAQVDEIVRAAFIQRFGDRGATLYQRRLNSRAPSSPLAALGDLRASDMFIAPSLEVAVAQRKHGQPAYVYQFDWSASQSGVEACHCIDLPFLFGDFGHWDARMLKGASLEEMQALSAAFQDALTGFAKTGTPNAADRPTWPAHGDGGEAMHFGRLIAATPVRGADLAVMGRGIDG